MTRSEQIEEAAKNYSDGQFAMGESRTVAPYVNESIFGDAFTAGAEWADKNWDINTFDEKHEHRLCLAKLYEINLIEEKIEIAMEALEKIKLGKHHTAVEACMVIADKALAKIETIK